MPQRRDPARWKPPGSRQRKRRFALQGNPTTPHRTATPLPRPRLRIHRVRAVLFAFYLLAIVYLAVHVVASLVARVAS